jgi:hypothetical protein
MLNTTLWSLEFITENSGAVGSLLLKLTQFWAFTVTLSSNATIPKVKCLIIKLNFLIYIYKNCGVKVWDICVALAKFY